MPAKNTHSFGNKKLYINFELVFYLLFAPKALHHKSDNTYIISYLVATIHHNLIVQRASCYFVAKLIVDK